MKNYSNLSKSLNTNRIFFESRNQYRSSFQRDRDRIIHSASFRRLKHKTQVFVNTLGDHHRTRITHSLEVAQIARSISRYLNLNDDLAETLSLAHDLGHTPFGHAGEDSLKDCMEGYGSFDHNLQTLRIVMFLEKKYLKFDGLNLTIEAIDGLLKHNGPIKELNLVNKIIGLKNFKKKINFYEYPSLEAQISNLSDDVAYNNHDIQDGISANIFSLNDLLELKFFNDLYKNIRLNKKNKKNKTIITQEIIRNSINLMVKDLIKTTIKNINNKKIKSLSNVKKNKFPIISFSDKYRKIITETNYFLRVKMYNNKNVIKKNNNGKKIIKFLFNKISKNPNKFKLKENISTNKYRAISDYISGMTDRYAINLYNNLK
jgi:dGTPase|tara:strand:+ start:1187 stop:2308 length:1122 start_codon:yes stop_codon:yes gene_type:complete